MPTPLQGSFWKKWLLAAEATVSVGKCLHQAGTSEHCNFIPFLHNYANCATMQLGSGVNSPFQNQPQIDGIHISAVSLRDLTELCRPSDFKNTSADFWKIWSAWRVSFIHLSFCGGFLSKTSTMISWLQVSRGETMKCVNLLQSLQHHSDTIMLYRHSHPCRGRQLSRLHWWRPGRSRQGCCGFHRCILSNENSFQTHPVQTTVEW